jgi:hypothetical protein
VTDPVTRTDRDLPIAGATGMDEGLTVLQLLEALKKDRDKQKGLVDAARIRERIVLGEQWLAVDPSIERDFNDGMVEGIICENLLFPNVLTYGARVNQGRIQPKAFPVHPTTGDVASAQASESVLDYERRQCDEDDLIADASFLAQVHGDVYFYPVWDESKGPFQVRRQAQQQKLDEAGPVFTEDGKPVMEPAFDEAGQPVMEDAWEYGGISEEVIAAPDYWTDLVDEFDKATYVVVARTIDVYTAKRRLSRAGFLDCKVSSDHAEQNPADLDVRGVETYEIWHKPGARFDKGLFALVIGGYVVKAIDYPYEHGELPGCVWKIQKVRNSPRGKTHVADAIWQQKRVNIALRAIMRRTDVAGDVSCIGHSAHIEAYKTAGGTRKLIPSDLDKEKDPRFISGPEVPKTLFDEYISAKRALQDVFGQNEATNTGGDPTQTSSGEQLKTAQALDAQKIVSARRALEKSRLRVARQKLKLDVQFWEDARLIRVVGPDGIVDAKWLKGADLGGADVALEVGSGVMSTHLAGQRMAEERAAAGYITPQQGAEMSTTGLGSTVEQGDLEARIDAQAMGALRGKPQQPLPGIDPKQAIAHLQEIAQSPLAENGNTQALMALMEAYRKAGLMMQQKPQQGAGRMQTGPEQRMKQQRAGATKMRAEQVQPEGVA